MISLERQRFSGERITHDVLNPSWVNFLRLTLQTKDPFGIFNLRGFHTKRYGFSQDIIDTSKRRSSDGQLIILDSACGIGYGSNLLLPSNQRKIVGVDIDRQTIQEANDYAGEYSTFVHGDLQRLPFPNEAFDYIISLETIEHVENPGQALYEMSRVLKPRGTLVVSTPNRDFAHPTCSIKDKPRNRYHKFELSSEEFNKLIGQYFEDVYMYAQGYRNSKKSIFEKLLEKIGKLGQLTCTLVHFLQIKELTEVVPVEEGIIPAYLVAVCKGKKASI